MVNCLFNRRMLMMLAGLLIITVSLSACDPLRKKFVRQKKQTQTQDFDAVLEPQEYLPPDKDPVENYKLHYNLMRAWYRDLWTAVSDRSSDSMAKSALKEISSHIEQMKPLLKQEKAAELDKLADLLKYYQSSLQDIRERRNYSRIQSDLRAFDRMLRAKFRDDKLKGSFVNQ